MSGEIQLSYPVNLKKSVLSVRNSGLANMFDIPRVFEVMLELGYYDEADWMITNRNEYLNFVFLGCIED